MPFIPGIVETIAGLITVDDKIGFLYNVVGDYILDGYSGASTLAELRSFGFRMSDSLFYAVRRDVLGVQNEYELLRYFPSNYIPKDTDFGLSDRPIDMAYRVIYRVSDIDPMTGARNHSFFGVDMNSVGSIGSLEDSGWAYVEQYYPGLVGDDTTIEIWKGIRAK